MSESDYGAILKVDGKFINKNFDTKMIHSNTGYIIDSAEYEGGSLPISGYYYAYAGDDKLMLCFHKYAFCVISKGKVVSIISGIDHIRETIYLDHLTNITIEHIDPNFYTVDISLCNDSQNKKEHIKYLRSMIKNRRYKRYPNAFNRYRTNRWRVTWVHDNHKYEVIYGYGIDSDEVVWNMIRDDSNYYFTDMERNIIDNWFNGR